MNNISFQAQINIDRNLIQKNIVSDKFFNEERLVKLFQILDNVDSFSKLKEESVVDVSPRLDNNQLNLITVVKDKTGIVNTVINERSARKMSSNESFAEKFLRHIKQSIKNVQVSKEEAEALTKFIESSKNLVDNNFTQKISKHIFDALQKGYNPTKRIMYILRKIEEEFPNEKNIISIKTERKKPKEVFKTGKCITYFCLNNSLGERRIVIHNLLKDPASNIWC